MQTFASTTRKRAAQTALRWLARAMPLVPTRATELLVAYEPRADEVRTRRRFGVIVAQARRWLCGGTTLIVRGRDLYATSGAIAAWCARQLVARAARTGRHARGERIVSGPRRRCTNMATIANLAVEPSFA